MSGSSPAEEPSRQKPKPTLHWISLLIVLAGLGAVLALGLGGGGSESNTAYQTGRAIGQWMGAMLVAAVLGLIAFWSSQRSSRLMNIVFCLAFAVVLLLNAATSSRRNAGAMAQLKSEVDSTRSRMQAALDADDEKAARAEAASVSQKMRDASKTMSGDDAVATTVGAEFVDYLLKASEPFNTAIQAFVEAGSISPDGLTPATADARLKLLSEVSRNHRHLRSLLGEVPAWIEGRYKAHGFSDAKAQSNARAFLSGAKLDNLTQMHEQTAILVEQFQLILQHLRNTHGRWRIDQDADSLVFEIDAEGDRYNALVETMQAAAEKEAEFQKKTRSR